MNLEFIRKVDKGTLWRMIQKGKPYELPAIFPESDNTEPNQSSYILIAPSRLTHSPFGRIFRRATPILTFYISNESGAKGAYRGFALTRDLDRAKQEFEEQLGHRGAIEANSKGL
jgi:hypothetical protein